MKKNKMKRWTVWHIKDGEIGFVYEIQGVLDPATIGFITISGGQTNQTRVSIASLVSMTSKEKVAWIVKRSLDLAKLGNGSVETIADANGVTAQVKQALKTNIAVWIAKDLEAPKSRQAVVEAMQTLTAAIESNDPPMTVVEAHEVDEILSRLYGACSGSLKDQIEMLILKLESLFPEEKFE